MDALKKALFAFVDFVIPEEKRLQKLLTLNPEEMRKKLPRPRAIDVEEVTALFDYRDKNVRLLVHALKYKGNLGVIKRLSLYLYEEIIQMVGEASLFEGIEGNQNVLIVPIPSSNKRKSERGWNQCELLCQEIEKLETKEIKVRFDILKKIQNTEKQADLTREKRLKNVKGSMRVEKGKMERLKDGMKNNLFIIIDDVYTTGATYREARRALKGAGAKKVTGVFIAH